MPTCKSFGGQAPPLALFKIFVGENIQDAESGRRISRPRGNLRPPLQKEVSVCEQERIALRSRGPTLSTQVE